MSLPTIKRPFMRKWVDWTGKHFSRRVDQKLDLTPFPPAPSIQANLTSLLLTKSPSVCVSYYSENIQPGHIPNKWIPVQTLRGILSQLCRLFLPEVAWTMLSAKYGFTNKVEAPPGLQISLPCLPLLKTQVWAPQPQQLSPTSTSTSTCSSTSDHLLFLLRGTRSKSDSTWFQFYTKLFLSKTCIVIKSTSSGTKSRISDSHWLHNQVFAIKHAIHLNRIFLPFIGWLSPQLQHWYLIAATIV